MQARRTQNQTQQSQPNQQQDENAKRIAEMERDIEKKNNAEAFWNKEKRKLFESHIVDLSTGGGVNLYKEEDPDPNANALMTGEPVFRRLPDGEYALSNEKRKYKYTIKTDPEGNVTCSVGPTPKSEGDRRRCYKATMNFLVFASGCTDITVTIPIGSVDGGPSSVSAKDFIKELNTIIKIANEKGRTITLDPETIKQCKANNLFPANMLIEQLPDGTYKLNKAGKNGGKGVHPNQFLDEQLAKLRTNSENTQSVDPEQAKSNNNRRKADITLKEKDKLLGKEDFSNGFVSVPNNPFAAGAYAEQKKMEYIERNKLTKDGTALTGDKKLDAMSAELDRMIAHMGRLDSAIKEATKRLEGYDKKLDKIDPQNTEDLNPQMIKDLYVLNGQEHTKEYIDQMKKTYDDIKAQYEAYQKIFKEGKLDANATSTIEDQMKLWKTATPFTRPAADNTPEKESLKKIEDVKTKLDTLKTAVDNTKVTDVSNKFTALETKTEAAVVARERADAAANRAKQNR